MAKDLTKLGDRLTKTASLKTVDLFTMSTARMDRLRTLNSRSKARGEVGSTSASAEAARLKKLEVARSKNPHLLEAYSKWALDLYGDAMSPSSYPMPQSLTNPMAFLLYSPFGKDLRERMINEPLIASEVIYAITRGAELQISRTHNDVMITRPVHAYIDMRDGIIERVHKTGAYNRLIQKQERLLQRIGTTIDFILTKEAHSSNASVRLFITSWSNHVTQMTLASSTARYTAPAALTIQMMELLLATCDVQRVMSKVSDGIRIKKAVYALYPMKELSHEIAGGCRLDGSARFFNP